MLTIKITIINIEGIRMKNAIFSRLGQQTTKALLFLSIVASTQSLSAQNTADSTQNNQNNNKKFDINATLFQFKENVISTFEHSKNKVQQTIQKNKSNISEAEVDSIMANNELYDAITASQLKERPSTDNITKGAAIYIIDHSPNTIIHKEYANFTYGELEGATTKDKAEKLIEITTRKKNGTPEENKRADATYDATNLRYLEMNARKIRGFVQETIRPDLEKGENSQFVKQLGTSSELSQILPEGIILDALNQPEHINAMTNNPTVDNDTVASMERIAGYMSTRIGVGGTKHLFNLILEGKGNEDIKTHFSNGSAIEKNIVRTYDLNDSLQGQNLSCNAVFNIMLMEYIMDRASAENPIFETKENVVLETKEQNELRKEAIIKAIQEQDTVPTYLLSDAFGNEVKTKNLLVTLSSEQPIDIKNKETRENVAYLAASRTIGVECNFYNRDSLYKNGIQTAPDKQFTIHAKFCPNATFYEGVGTLSTQTGASFGELGMTITRKAHSFTATAKAMGLSTTPQRETLQEGGHRFYTLGYNANIINGATKKGTQWNLNAGPNVTFSKSSATTLAFSTEASIMTNFKGDGRIAQYANGIELRIKIDMYGGNQGTQFNLSAKFPIGKSGYNVRKYNATAFTNNTNPQKGTVYIPGRQAIFNRSRNTGPR